LDGDKEKGRLAIGAPLCEISAEGRSLLTGGSLIYMGQRVVLILFTTLAVSSLVFLGVHSLPGNAFISEHRINPQAIAEIMHHYNLDLPLWDQYRLFMSNLILHGNLRESVINRGVQLTPLLLREAPVRPADGGVALPSTVAVAVPPGAFVPGNHTASI